MRVSGDSLVEGERMCDGPCAILFVCLCVTAKARGKKVREGERACQPTWVMKNAWGLWCQFAGAKAAEKSIDEVF